MRSEGSGRRGDGSVGGGEREERGWKGRGRKGLVGGVREVGGR